MRIYRPLTVDHEHVEFMRQFAQQCRELLKQPRPDAFLGRKTTDAPRKEDGQGGDAGGDDGMRFVRCLAGSTTLRIEQNTK